MNTVTLNSMRNDFNRILLLRDLISGCIFLAGYLVARLRFQTGVDILLHVEQVLQQPPPHRLAHGRFPGSVHTSLFSASTSFLADKGV